MQIKSFEEIKNLIEKFPEAGGIGFVILPQLLKIANEIGLSGYADALGRWELTSVLNEKTGELGELTGKIVLGFTGPSILYLKEKDQIYIGIEQTVKNIEEALKLQ